MPAFNSSQIDYSDFYTGAMQPPERRDAEGIYVQSLLPQQAAQPSNVGTSTLTRRVVSTVQVDEKGIPKLASSKSIVPQLKSPATGPATRGSGKKEPGALAAIEKAAPIQSNGLGTIDKPNGVRFLPNAYANTPYDVRPQQPPAQATRAPTPKSGYAEYQMSNGKVGILPDYGPGPRPRPLPTVDNYATAFQARQAGTPAQRLYEQQPKPSLVPTQAPAQQQQQSRPITYDQPLVTTPGQGSVNGIDLMFMPNAVQQSSRWRTGY